MNLGKYYCLQVWINLSNKFRLEASLNTVGVPGGLQKKANDLGNAIAFWRSAVWKGEIRSIVPPRNRCFVN